MALPDCRYCEAKGWNPEHPMCAYGAGSLYCINPECLNPHHGTQIVRIVGHLFAGRL